MASFCLGMVLESGRTQRTGFFSNDLLCVLGVELWVISIRGDVLHGENSFTTAPSKEENFSCDYVTELWPLSQSFAPVCAQTQSIWDFISHTNPIP